MKSRWWIWAIVITVPLVVCGFLWNPKQTGIAAAIGGGLLIFASFGDTVAPTANQKAYYDRRTGRRVHSDGTPYYNGVVKYIKDMLGAAIVSAYAGMAIYGVYAAIKLFL